MITVNRLRMNLNKYKNMTADIKNMDPARLLAMVINDRELEIAKEQHDLELRINALRFVALHSGMRTRDLVEQGVLEVDLNRSNGNRSYS